MLLAVWIGGAAAQDAKVANAPDAGKDLPKFDVVSIKPYGPTDMRISISTRPDGVAVRGMPMHMILREAFGVTNDRLLGEPDWVRSDRFDFDAKVSAEDVPTFEQLDFKQQWSMLVPVLEERCTLRFHHETRDLTTYVLVVAKGGPKLEPSQVAGGQTNPAPGRGAASAGVSVGDKGVTMSGHGASMASIARWISLQLGSTVVDKTGLTATYDYSVEFAPDESMRAGMLPPGPGGGSPPPESEGPSIFAALQEQLGLKLEARKEPVDVVVIDHIDRPTEN